MFEGLFQPLHMIIILAIALIIFGPGKLPELGKGLGKAMREFKSAMSDATKEINVTPQAKEAPKRKLHPPPQWNRSRKQPRLWKPKKKLSNRTT